ncbi:MAG: topoisomerase [Solibacillus sp.]
MIVIDTSKNGENDVNIFSDSETEIDLLSELQNEIIASITEQTEINKESITIMLDGNATDLSVSVGFLKNVKVDDTLIQQIVEDSIERVSETQNVVISEEDITIKIEKY